MSALTRARMTVEERWKRHLFPLTAAKTAWKGGVACIDTATGFVVPGAASLTLIRIGMFAEDVDNSAGVTTTPVNVDLDQEIVVRWLDNDTGGTPVVATDVGNQAFILDDHTVTKASAGNSPAGMIWAVDSNKGVAVQTHFEALGDSTAPAIQKGTSTLIAGTKTVTGVTLTSSSRIFVTMKDPGAGAITALAALDVPAGTRNTSTGQFVVNAIDDAKAVLTTAVSTFDWLIVG